MRRVLVALACLLPMAVAAWFVVGRGVPGARAPAAARGPAALPAAARPLAHPATVVVVLDRSMPEHRLGLAKQAARRLVTSLEPQDRLGFIAAGGELLTQSGSRLLTDDGRRRLLAWLDETGTMTGSEELGLGPTLQMADGLLALTEAGEQSARLILISDGAHVAGVLSNAELQRAVTALSARGARVDAASPGRPEARPPLEALAELGGGRLLVLKDAADIDELLR